MIKLPFREIDPVVRDVFTTVVTDWTTGQRFAETEDGTRFSLEGKIRLFEGLDGTRRPLAGTEQVLYDACKEREAVIDALEVKLISGAKLQLASQERVAALEAQVAELGRKLADAPPASDEPGPQEVVETGQHGRPKHGHGKR